MKAHRMLTKLADSMFYDLHISTDVKLITNVKFLGMASGRIRLQLFHILDSSEQNVGTCGIAAEKDGESFYINMHHGDGILSKKFYDLADFSVALKQMVEDDMKRRKEAKKEINEVIDYLLAHDCIELPVANPIIAPFGKCRYVVPNYFQKVRIFNIRDSWMLIIIEIEKDIIKPIQIVCLKQSGHEWVATAHNTCKPKGFTTVLRSMVRERGGA